MINSFFILLHTKYMKIINYYLKILFIILLLIISYKNYKEEDNIFVINDNDFYLASYEIVDNNVFKDSFINYLYKSEVDGNYLSKIYDYNTKEELNIIDLIKKEELGSYYKKIEVLLSKKYPYYIVQELVKNNGHNSYLFKDNELIIYFDNYNIDIEEDLFIRINYNEIHEYLNFEVTLDKDYKNESGYDYKKNKKSVAFTFDDSPNIGKTNRLVEILNDNYATATFFMVGSKMEVNKKLVSLVHYSRNEIGSHTYYHKNLRRLTNDEIEEDTMLFNNLYKNITGEKTYLYRPPYGIINKKNINPNLVYVMWDVDTLDWKYRDKNYIVNKVLNEIEDGNIILFHDSYESTIDAVEELLPILYKKGYQVVSVSELAKLKNRKLMSSNFYYHIN